ncbi:MAG TPA: RNA polymerase sigma factor [Thermoanaerobaculia bacterium]|jgi:RNA polymerase sigma factor (sigma-70 family)
MDEMLTLDDPTAEQDRRIAQAVAREGSRLKAFIRRRVADAGDAEDVLQEVLFELVEAVRLMTPIEQVGAWLFRVARNRIIDLFRRRSPEAPRGVSVEDEAFALEGLLPSSEGGPEVELARGVLLEELAAALDELPEEQREVFIAHEIEGRSFKDLAAETGLSINTLLSRKHYAVLHLRRRLRDIHDEFQRLGA